MMNGLKNPFTRRVCENITFVCNKYWYNELNIPSDFSQVLKKISNPSYKEYLVKKYSQSVLDKFIAVYSNTSNKQDLISFDANFDIRKKFRSLCEEIFGFKEGLYSNVEEKIDFSKKSNIQEQSQATTN